MIIKNFINGQITTGTEPIDPISGVSRGLYINSVLSGNSTSDTLVGLDINPSYSGIAGNYFGLRVSGDTIFATSGGTQVFRTNNSGVAITGTLSNTTGAQFATSSGNVLIGTTTDAGYKLDVNGTGRFSGGIFQSMGTSSLNLLVAGTTSQTSDRGVFVGNGSFNNASVVGVALGYGLTLGTGTGNVAIGYTASVSGGGIAISSTGLGASASGGGIAVGGGSSSTGGVAIGGTTNTSGAVGIKGSATAVNAVAINGTASGNFSLSIGDRCTASHTQSIAIGLGSKTSAVGDFVAGGYFPNGGYGIYNVYFGTGPQGDQTNEINGDSYAINGSGGFGTNKNGGNLTLAGGKGTGNGTPGDVIISTATSGSTGSTLQTLTTRLVVKANTGNVGIGTSSPTNPLDIAFSPGRLISFQAVPGYAVSGQIVFSNATSAGIVSSGTIGLGPGDTNKTVTLGNGIISKITTPGSTKYDCYGNQTPSTLAGTTNRPVLFTSTIADGCIDGFIFENTSSGSKNLFKVIQDNTTLLTLNPNGNFFLGTTTDLGFKLSVSGSTLLRGSGTTSASYALATQNSSGGTTMVVNNAGNMLIGTTTDAGYKLDVNGTARLNSTTLIEGPLTVNFGGVVGGTSIVANGNTIHNGGRGIYTTGYAYGIQANQTMVGNWSSQPNAAGVHGTGQIGVFGSGDIAGFSGPSAFFTVLNGDDRVSARSHISTFQIRGSGSTELTNTLLLENSSGIKTFTVNDNGNVLIGLSGSTGQKLQVSGTSLFTGTFTSLTGGSSQILYNMDLSQSAITGNTIYAVNVSPTLRNTASGQTQVALRVMPTFTGSSTGTSTTNKIVDFGSAGVGTQFTVTDATTGDIYMVNDVSGLPIIAANSSWDVSMYNYPNTVFKKTNNSLLLGVQNNTGSTVSIYGDLVINEGFGFTNTTTQVSGTTSTGATSAATIYTLTTSTNKSYSITCLTTGYGNTTRNTTSGRVEGAFRNSGGTLTMVGTTIQYVSANIESTNVDFEISGTSIVLRVTGTTSENYTWGSTITSQVI